MSSTLLSNERNRLASSLLAIFVAAGPLGSALSADEQGAESAASFRAGVAAIDITPQSFPRIIAGSFLEHQASQIHTPLFARAFVLSDGDTKVAIVVVDTCMMPQPLIDQAKQIAAQRCDIAADHMMVSATHTHSAPAAMSCLGTRVDKEYAAWLTEKIAEAILAADANLQPARIGWASIDDWEHTHNRRWIRKPDRMVVDPFGDATGRAHMHPGYQSADVIGPSGPVDPGLSLISLQTLDGRPLGVFANYSQHYFGSPAVSADYYGRFSKYIADELQQPGDGNGPFVCAMSQGTSGDLMWMDYGSAAKQISMQRYAQAVAAYAQDALASITYHDSAPLAIVEKELALRYRVPDEQRLQWARSIAENIDNELPKNLPEVYATEALILHERQSTSLKLQAIRIGDLTIATLPNEVYALTGLKLKAQSPLGMHLNVGLANGAEGYIPPPEQHVLGGYTTWPARTAGLEIQAETRIVETLVQALEEATAEPRRKMTSLHGPYAKAILEANPQSYLRLDDAEGTRATNAVAGGAAAQLEPGFAWYLPGVGSGSGIGPQQQLTASAFSGPEQINRSVHLAGGSLRAPMSHTKTFSIAVWFWLGEPSGAGPRSGSLITLPSGESLIAHQDAAHSVQLQLGNERSQLPLRADDWHFAVLACDGQRLQVFIDGETALETTHVPAEQKSAEPTSEVRFGIDLQGKLDEIALFDRALTHDAIKTFWQLSGIPQQRAEELAEDERLQQELAERMKPPAFPADYEQAIAAMKPIVAASLTAATEPLKPGGNVTFSADTFARFAGGRLAGTSPELSDAYSVSVWFRCETPTDVQPVTAYFFSRGVDADAQAPGDHLGIGGTYRPEHAGRLMFFNGNKSNQVLIGQSAMAPGTWNHVVLVRKRNRVRAWLNGQDQAEIDGEVEVTTGGEQAFYLGARSDYFAPLHGQMVHFALFNRALEPDEGKQLHAASGQPTGTTQPLSHNQPAPQSPPEPASEPLSLEEALAGIHVPDGFRVELVAAEPDVLDPIAFDWDAEGRLWVVEMADYPLGIDGKGQPGGRIRVLEDSTGDGRYDRSRLFAEGLNFPTGIMTWRDGVLVTAAPEILLLRDTDGDGRADSREVLLEGFHEGNQQLRINGLRWGLDGWIYCANGGHHAGHGVGTRIRSRRDGQTYTIDSRDFRFRPDTGELQLESGPSQFGRNRDAWGNWFGTQNAKPLWHYVIADRYLARNPFVPAPQPIRHILSPDSPVVFPASAPEKRYHNFDQSGRFTSACSGMIYGDDRMFSDSVHSHAFICEPFHNLVQHQLLSADGVSFTATRGPGEEEHDFFASEDRWCRPVMTRTGPDGSLWVADMYRYMIEHPDWLPAKGKAELMPHYRLGEDRGRIYRITSQTASPRDFVRLDSLNIQQLVAAIDSPNDWQRDKVQQMLQWQPDPAAPALLELVYRDTSRPQTQVQVLWTLAALDELGAAMLVDALGSEHARVRQTAVRLSERRDEQAVIGAAAGLAHDSDPHVRLQLALSCGQWQTQEAADALAILSLQGTEDSLMVAAILSSSVPHIDTLLPTILQSDSKAADTYRGPLLRQAIGSGNARSIARLIDDALADSPQEAAARLEAFLMGLQQMGSSLDQLPGVTANEAVAAGVDRIRNRLKATAAELQDERLSDAERLAAAALLSCSAAHRELATAALVELLDPRVDADVQATAITTLGRSAADTVPEILGDAWPRLSPQLRAAAIDVWLSRTLWAASLLQRIERRDILPSQLQPAQQASLKNHPDGSVAQRAKALLASDQTSEPKEIVRQYRGALELTGDPEKGQAVYLKHCASCHRRGGEGHQVGPDLATVIHHTAEKLLVNILDPNADIQPGYQVYHCLLETGELVSGILTSETANSLTISGPNGAIRTVGRGEIEQLQTPNVSLMPEGLHENMSEQELADLIALLKQPLQQPSPAAR